MKKLTLLLLFAIMSSIFAQSPNSFKYQTVVRNTTGVVLPNQDISFQISILQGSATGTSVYLETHAVTTNEFGLVNLNIGGGTTSDDFSTIDWGNGPFFIKVELDENGGTAYAEMGTSQLLSVPYAMYANDVANKDDADADPNNELQIMNFSNDTLYLDNGGQVYLGEYSSLWGQNDTNIFYNNGWVGVGTSTPSGMMVVQGDEGVDPDSALFEVKNKNGQTIFAVYDGGVRIWVDDTGAKTNTDKGGFAVGGYRLNKSISSEYLRVTPDSVRVYIREDDGTKTNTDKGGFAVGGYRLNKSTTSEYFNINPNENADTLNPSEARIYWYPLKEAFLSGRVLVESVDSVGINSWASGFESKAIGNYSQALGYKARAFGDNSTAIGNFANAVDSGSYAIGSGAKATGLRSFALGSTGVDSLGVATAPTIARGDYAYAFGMGSLSYGTGSFAFGTQDTALGDYSLAMGYQCKSAGDFSTAIGVGSEAVRYNSVAIGVENKANGSSSVALGYKNEVSSDFGGVAIGFQNLALGRYSSVMGRYSQSNGFSSVALGEEANSSGMYSIAVGYKASSSGSMSLALGYASAAYGTVAVSIGGIARGTAAKSLGTSTIAKSYCEVVVGYNNDTTVSINETSWIDTDPIFIVGNGLSGGVIERHNALMILKNGNIGINTNSPEAPLDIETNSSGYALHIEENGAGTEEWQIGVNSLGDLNFFDGSTVRAVFKDYGYLGIGTTTPGSHRLCVASGVGGTSGSTGFFSNSSSSGLAMIIENSSTSSSDNTLLVSQKGTGDIVSFDSYHGTGSWDREFKFTNDGDGRCDGSWIAGGADYAEFFPKADISTEYEAGDIITMSPNKTYSVEGATKENAQLMIGVYSSNPAIVGNAEAEKDPENSVLVGMVGVIKTKVNTENGAIKIGDYITISSTPKVGMKATNNGMVVGRAMDNYDSKGTGMINVLVETDWYYNTEEGNITSSEIKNTLNKQQSDIEILKAEIEQLKQILEVKAEK